MQATVVRHELHVGWSREATLGSHAWEKGRQAIGPRGSRSCFGEGWAYMELMYVYGRGKGESCNWAICAGLINSPFGASLAGPKSS